MGPRRYTLREVKTQEDFERRLRKFLEKLYREDDFTGYEVYIFNLLPAFKKYYGRAAIKKPLEELRKLYNHRP